MNAYLVILFCAILSFVTLTVVVYLDRDTVQPNKATFCDTMFSGGYYLFSELGKKTLWNPHGCNLMFRETIEESERCMKIRSLLLNKTTHIVLMGDSRLRQLRDGLIYQLSGVEHDFYVNKSVADNSRLYKSHESTVTEIEKAGVRVEFFWVTEMDNGNGTLGLFLNRIEKYPVLPDIIFVGGGLWIIRSCTERRRNQTDCALEFQRSFDRQLTTLNRIAQKSKVIWVPQNLVVEAKLMAVHFTHSEMTNRRMMIYNSIVQHALRLFERNKVVYWNSFLEIDLQVDDTPDGMHLGKSTRYIDIQIILNYFCNPVVSPSLNPFMTGSAKSDCCCCRTT